MKSYQNFYELYLPKVKQIIDQGILDLKAPDELKTSMKYSIDAGGKRLRPIMTLAIYQAFGGKIDDSIIKIACSVELIHTYSLIHDDLPAMDNDDFRRGLPTSHKKFGEAQAILAGDGLLTLAFMWISNSNSINNDIKVNLINNLSKSAGPEGMVGGQVADMLGVNKVYTHDELKTVHNLKTGALLSYASMAGGILANVSDSIVEKLSEFGLKYGLAFQIQDDLLDVHDVTDLTKNTYPHLLGVENTKNELQKLLSQTDEILNSIVIDTDFDKELVGGLLSYFERKNK